MPTTAPDTEPEGWVVGEDAIGFFADHPELNLRIRWLGAVTGLVGMTEAEYQAARRLAGGDPYLTVEEMTPPVEASVGPLWISEVPVTEEEVLGVGAQPGLRRRAALVTHDEAVTVCRSLGGRLATEAEWELACRGGASSLFVWGDDLLQPEELEGWLDWDLLEARPRNALGLGGLFYGEWCADRFTVGRGPAAEVLADAYVIKGGGARFWPWQDQEWVWCMPSMRMPSTDLFEDARAAFRLVIEGR